MPRRPSFFAFDGPALLEAPLFLARIAPPFLLLMAFWLWRHRCLTASFTLPFAGGFGVVVMAAMGQDDEKKRVRLKKNTSKFGHDKKCLYLCNHLRQATRALSSAGLEHLPYKQRVGGSNPSAPTRVRDISTADVSFAFTGFMLYDIFTSLGHENSTRYKLLLILIYAIFYIRTVYNLILTPTYINLWLYNFINRSSYSLS